MRQRTTRIVNFFKKNKKNYSNSSPERENSWSGRVCFKKLYAKCLFWKKWMAGLSKCALQISETTEQSNFGWNRSGQNLGFQTAEKGMSFLAKEKSHIRTIWPASSQRISPVSVGQSNVDLSLGPRHQGVPVVPHTNKFFSNKQNNKKLSYIPK